MAQPMSRVKEACHHQASQWPPTMKAPDPITCPYVRGSTDSDLAVILRWLKSHHDEFKADTFWVSRQVIERCLKGGEPLVYESPDLAEPVAFQLGGLLRPGSGAQESRAPGRGRSLRRRRRARGSTGDGRTWGSHRRASSVSASCGKDQVSQVSDQALSLWLP